MKNKETLKKIIYLVLFIIALSLAKRIAKNYLLENNIDSYNIHLSVKVVFNIILIIASLFAIQKLNFFKTGGLSKIKLQKPALLIFPFAYLTLLNVVFLDAIPNCSISNIFILIIYCLSIGFAEELSLRSLLLPLMLKLYNGSKKQYLKAVFLSSLIFGLLHLINFNKGLYGEFAQIFYATFIGFAFGALLLITKRIYPLIIIHAIIDFVGKLDSINKPVKETVYNPMDIESSILTVLLTVPCLIYGFIILKKFLKND